MSIHTVISSKAIQLSPFETFLMALKGKRDGKIGLPRQDENSNWYSPQCSKEAGAYYAFTAKKWARAENKNAALHREIATLERNANNKQHQLDRLAAECPPAPEINFACPGEEGVNPEILRKRRQSEHQAAYRKYFAKCDELRSYIEQALDKISEHRARTAEVENITRLICERAKHRSEQRISAYWHGLLCTNANMEIPVSPAKIKDSDAERIYFSHHCKDTCTDYLNQGGTAHENSPAI
jgi:hypothetical protein